MRILFYAKRNLHLPHLEPVMEWINANRPEIKLTYSSPPYIPSRNGFPGLGLEDYQISALQANGPGWIPVSRINNFNPDITVLADADFGDFFWDGRIVNINHGLICKGTFYTRATTVQRENRADLICTPGEYHASILKQVLKNRVLATGFSKFDPIGKGELTRESARQDLGLAEEDKVVLFAPTYNQELSAVPVVTDGIRDLIKLGYKVLVKLHGMAPKAWFELYDILALLDTNIEHIKNQDITSSLMAADVVISDVSSAFMEAMALGRPVILVNNPNQHTFHSYDPEDIEYKWRDVGLEVNSTEEMIQAVERSFAFPEEKESKREYYGPQLVGPIDGRAAERAAIATLQIMEDAPVTAYARSS
ncbi:CDP-glycerol glycerophosphotransferase family protein [Calditrichota bacterium]